MIQIKSQKEIDKMAAVGKLVSDVLNEVAKKVRPGISLIELDELAEKLSIESGAKPAFKGYKGYPYSLCTSVNEQVVHGMPSQRTLKEGDIVGLDFGLSLNGFFGDSAITLPVGKVSAEATQLMKATCESLFNGIKASRAGNTLKDVARAIESTVKVFGYGIVRDFVGHGIGTKLHEDPQVANYEAGASNIKLKAGMTIAIEPMITVGGHEVEVLSDRWTAVTRDKSLSAHYEHTILITEGDPQILTYWGDKPFDGKIEWAINGGRIG
jgi:methionyl aminopeptidase